MSLHQFHKIFISVVLTFAVSMNSLLADVQPEKVFSDNMVLQRNQSVPVYGFAAKGEKIKVSFNGQVKKTVANSDGKWKVLLDPMKVELSGQSLTIEGTNKVEFKNVLVGDVWLCSGQSNMVWGILHDAEKEKAFADADYPNVRLLFVDLVAKAKPSPLGKVKGWSSCSKQVISDHGMGLIENWRTHDKEHGFSGIAFYFGRKLFKETGIPIGIIASARGGSEIKAWTPKCGYVGIKELQKDMSALDQANIRSYQDPLSLYNGMIHGLIPFGIKGVIWYQGEANVLSGSNLYYNRMQALIYGWRKLWKNDKLPFIFTEVCPFKYNKGHELPKLWEEQQKSLNIPFTAMAQTNDLGELHNIHPTNKRIIGERLADIALAKTYKRKSIICNGPIYQSHTIMNDKVTVKFKFTGSGLKSRNGKPLTHFELCGNDGIWHKADAAIKGAKVVVSSQAVKKPKHIRFAWHETAVHNFVNNEGLPASSFRSNR